MTLNENKKKTLVRTGGTLAVITSVALNLITVLDWLGISPKESAARNTQTVMAVQEVSSVEHVPLTQTIDYGATTYEDVIEEAVFISDDDYILVQEEAIPMEEYYIPADEAVPQEAPVILNAVQLTDIGFSYASDSNGGFALRSSGTDITGKTYSPVLLTDTPVLITSDYEYLRYNKYYLYEQYNLFSGTVFLTEDYASTSGYVEFEIYGDDELLDCYVFTGGELPAVDFNVDITGVDILEIRATTSTDVSPVIGLANAFFAYY